MTPHPLFIAQVDPGTVEPWLKTLFWLVGGLAACVMLYRQLTNGSARTELTNQPIEVRAHPGVVSRAELEKMDLALHGRMKRERMEIDAQIRRVEEIAEKRLDKLERKIDENTNLTNEMCGQLGQINQSVGTLSSSLTNFMRDQASPNRPK
jgi:hypothetical protein